MEDEIKNFLLLTILAILISFGLSQVASAGCTKTGETPEGGNIIDCTPPPHEGLIDDASNPATTDFKDVINIQEGSGINGNGLAILTGTGGDLITTSGVLTAINQVIVGSDDNETVIMNGGSMQGLNANIQLTDGNDTIIMNAGHLISESSTCISAGGDNDTVEVNGGLLESDDNTVEGFSGDDKITVNGGTFRSNLEPIITGDPGNDEVFLNGGVYMPGVPVTVDLGIDDDTLTFGGDVNLNGSVDCNEGFDTIVFAMDVPKNQLGVITAEIEASKPAGDSIIINGINYEWENCEELQSNLGIKEPIPTISQWGLIAMAGILGLAGFMVIRRRAIA